jgi:hypothetical protein
MLVLFWDILGNAEIDRAESRNNQPTVSLESTAKWLSPRPVVSSQRFCARRAFADQSRCVPNKKFRPTSKGRP